jgi:hypothetical protein
MRKISKFYAVGALVFSIIGFFLYLEREMFFLPIWEWENFMPKDKDYQSGFSCLPKLPKFAVYYRIKGVLKTGAMLEIHEKTADEWLFLEIESINDKILEKKILTRVQSYNKVIFSEIKKRALSGGKITCMGFETIFSVGAPSLLDEEVGIYPTETHSEIGWSVWQAVSISHIEDFYVEDEENNAYPCTLELFIPLVPISGEDVLGIGES